MDCEADPLDSGDFNKENIANKVKTWSIMVMTTRKQGQELGVFSRPVLAKFTRKNMDFAEVKVSKA